MNVTISFKHLDHTPALDSRIKEKSEKLGKFLGGKTDVKWTCYVQEGNHYAELDIVGPHFDYHASANSDNLYKTLDMVVGKLEKQLIKKKEKMKNKLHRRNAAPVILDPEQAWADHDEDYYDDVA